MRLIIPLVLLALHLSGHAAGGTADLSRGMVDAMAKAVACASRPVPVTQTVFGWSGSAKDLAAMNARKVYFGG